MNQLDGQAMFWSEELGSAPRLHNIQLNAMLCYTRVYAVKKRCICIEGKSGIPLMIAMINSHIYA